MKWKFRYLVVLILLLSAAFVSAEPRLEYKRYINLRFGYGVSYPEGLLIPQGEADNADGQKFLSKESAVEMKVWGVNNVLDETLESRFREVSKGNNRKNHDLLVTYKHKANNWFVVSGFIGSKVFYQKTMLEDDAFLTLYITYSPREKQRWDYIVSDISKSFNYLGVPRPEASLTK